MSRMDRYKKIHDESEKADSKNRLSIRKERKKDKPSDSYQDESLSRQAEAYSNNGGSPYQDAPSTKKPKKIKKQRKSSLKKKIAIIFILFLVLEIASFFVGKVQADHDSSIPQQELEEFSGAKASDGSTNILFLGSDTREGEEARSDTIMVLHIGGIFEKPKLISFMRDTYVNIPGVGYNKINAAYAYGGADLVRQTLSQQFGIDCRYYAIVDFKSFEKVIDALFSRGVPIDAEKTLDLDGVHIEKGQQRMDGHTLLQYARFRMDEEGDFGRVRRQQQVMSAVFSQLKNPLNLLRIPYAGGKVLGYTSTNVPTTFLMSHAVGIARAGGGFDHLTVPVEDSWTYQNYDVGSVLDIDEQMNKDSVQAFLAK